MAIQDEATALMGICSDCTGLEMFYEPLETDPLIRQSCYVYYERCEGATNYRGALDGCDPFLAILRLLDRFGLSRLEGLAVVSRLINAYQHLSGLC